MSWHTKSDQLISGSWLYGRIELQVSDVSFDGKYMVYAARGKNGKSWTGVCNPPWLEAITDAECASPSRGGGFWHDAQTLILQNWEAEGLPFDCYTLDDWYRRLGQPPHYDPLIERYGWKDDGDSLSLRPAHDHTVLRFRDGTYSIDEFPDLLDEVVDSAAYDSEGSLVFSRLGVLTKCEPSDLKHGRTTYSFDLETLPDGERWSGSPVRR
ncbi:MAG: hypothetical protein AAF432_04830 [Planctomycetota bacterium]